ncbi:hypothetical protein [Actinopolymorpha pittospori]
MIELNDVQVLVALAIPDSWPGRVDDLVQPARALGIHPPAVTRGEGEVRAALGGSVDVHIAGAGAGVEGLGGVRVEVGEAAAVPNRLAGDRDPLALRLALLTRRHYCGAQLDPGILDEADATLHRWRDGVAVWARAPSRPMPRDVVREAYAAFENNLDTPSVLRQLDRLAGDVDVADGAKFETFVHLDRVLAVDLARDIGAGPG